MADIRDDIQKSIVGKYISGNYDKATLVLPTGFGKSMVAMLIIEELNPEKVLILVNSTDLRDNSWKEQFEEFGLGEYYENNVTTATYQAAYKWRKLKKDLSGYFVIADEIDFSGNTDKLSHFFKEYSENKTLGLTGFISKAKKQWFLDTLPVIVSMTTKEAQDNKLLNNVHIKVVKFLLNEEESAEYSAFISKISVLNAKQGDVNVKRMLNEITPTQAIQQALSLDNQIKRLLYARARFLYNLKSSAAVARKVLRKTHKEGASKSIVFSKTTDQSAKISKIVYNGTNKPKENRAIFRNFNSSEIANLGVVSKINRGVNIKGLNVGIWESFSSSETQFVQQRGRLLRLKPDETAKGFVLLPYYTNNEGEVKETQAVTWARKMLESHPRSFISVCENINE